MFQEFKVDVNKIITEINNLDYQKYKMQYMTQAQEDSNPNIPLNNYNEMNDEDMKNDSELNILQIRRKSR